MNTPNRWQHRAQWPLSGLAVAFLAAYSVRVLGQPHGTAVHVIDGLMLAAWAAFAADYAVRLWSTPHRGRWFVRHPLQLAIVAVPLLQPIRLLRLPVVDRTLQKIFGTAIHGRVTVYAAASAILVVYAASLAELQVERHDPHASINSFGKALFWSITTVTTVGYGFEHPTTTTGRTIAAALMICGISLVGTVTATVASWIVRRVGEEGPAVPPATAEHIEQLRGDIKALHARLDEAGTLPASTDAAPDR